MYQWNHENMREAARSSLSSNTWRMVVSLPANKMEQFAVSYDTISLHYTRSIKWLTNQHLDLYVLLWVATTGFHKMADNQKNNKVLFWDDDTSLAGSSMTETGTVSIQYLFISCSFLDSIAAFSHEPYCFVYFNSQTWDGGWKHEAARSSTTDKASLLPPDATKVYQCELMFT